MRVRRREKNKYDVSKGNNATFKNKKRYVYTGIDAKKKQIKKVGRMLWGDITFHRYRQASMRKKQIKKKKQVGRFFMGGILHFTQVYTCIDMRTTINNFKRAHSLTDLYLLKGTF